MTRKTSTMTSSRSVTLLDQPSLPDDYLTRVYAGVLGKIIGVYLGRPFEGWTHQRIIAELGEITDYVHDRLGQPLIVTDDDITGTFTFIRALEDRGFDPGLTPAQIGESWLNYLIENRTILWWGGLGTSTEHTAYLRLKSGIPAPASGSVACNGRAVAEQIGGQIFIDGWAMLSPGDPERAAELARRAASVSHDGDGIHGAQVIAAIEAQAFIEPDLETLLDTAVGLIPADCTLARAIADVRQWHRDSSDWYATRALIEQHYGYHLFPGVCHMVPNHALIIAALLHGDDDFSRTMMIINSSGWDTDCNSGSVGAIMGIKNGLRGIDDATGTDWRGPLADRLYLPCAEGGRAISDAATVAVRIANAGEILHGRAPTRPKQGARFHFSLPGSVQGFQSLGATPDDPEQPVRPLVISNDAGRLELTLREDSREAFVATPTFIPPEAVEMPGYQLIGSPTLYPSQRVEFTLAAPAANRADVTVRPLIDYYGAGDRVQRRFGDPCTLSAGADHTGGWVIPDVGGAPVLRFGFALTGEPGDALLVDRVHWDGAPTLTLGRPAFDSTLWRRAWVDGVDDWAGHWPEDYKLAQNRGTGLIAQGDETWTDYEVSADLDVLLALSAGVAARVGGLRRYYAAVIAGDRARLIKECDGLEVLAEVPLPHPGSRHRLKLQVTGDRISGTVDGVPIGSVRDHSLTGGAAGLLISEGTLSSGPVEVRSC
ncbi:ADP-ribosylglycohydrolase family protein [Microlunatus panaciterrae]|uniref:ADP-ribosylglycohydrolase n=1 Tax=Microlunatus panaciterrae TaxID=400768 RepID=A0ABS2RN10_9ACTN|nr:ADP-ribosylglycohydrolase family protein [Microlunatus panaciterrae]MBM7800058.1 ADP-ribosylglycohydrolase [Microlunatus panaciterrae]